MHYRVSHAVCVIALVCAGYMPAKNTCSFGSFNITCTDKEDFGAYTKATLQVQRGTDPKAVKTMYHWWFTAWSVPPSPPLLCVCVKGWDAYLAFCRSPLPCAFGGLVARGTIRW